VTRSRSCSVGCGVQTPPSEPTGYDLPPTDAATLEIVAVPYDTDTLLAGCMNESPPLEA
jgi:hypothetical protein